MPTLSEADARTLSTHIVAELQTLGASVQEIGVHLDRDGFTFLAEVNGCVRTARTGQGNFTYRAVARELLGTSVDLLVPPDLTIHRGG